MVQLFKTSKQTNKKLQKKRMWTGWRFQMTFSTGSQGILDSQNGETSVNIPGI